MQLTIRRKLILFTVLPVIVVFSALFALGISHVRSHLSSNAQDWLVEHAHHQAARLALTLSQIPLLAQSLGDLVLADPGQPQTLMYAHLIDGLRRTPLAAAAAISNHEAGRGAIMRRGEPAGHPLSPAENRGDESVVGWKLNDNRLRFNRPVYRHGEHVADTWVEVQISDIYAELRRQQIPTVLLLVSHDDGTLLTPVGVSAQIAALAEKIPLDNVTGQVQTVGGGHPEAQSFWMVSTELPQLPWRITALTPTATALLPARQEAIVVAGALLMALLLIVGIISSVARRITRPLASLNSSVQQIAAGDFTAVPQVSSNDELGGLATVIRRMGRHIADREHQLQTAHQVLEQRVAQRTIALQESNARLLRQIEETSRTEEALRLANERAQQANRAKSEFLSNMSHELRTPLHGVLGYAQILRRNPDTSTEQYENLEAIERCGQHLLTLINDILDLTKIEAGQMQLDLRATNLRQLLEDVRMIVAQRAQSKGLQLDLSLAPDLPESVITDPVKLKQILLNLLGNAVKFTENGSITLCAAPISPDRLRLEVIDTGIGIAADEIDSIFDAFNQARDGRSIDGTGLGLAINRSLIRLLGGEIFDVESEPGKGSRFGFEIPLQATATSVGSGSVSRSGSAPQQPQLVATSTPAEAAGDDAHAWPADLANETVRRIRTAIDLGDIASLFQLAEELAVNPAAPHADAEKLAVMARQFDLDGLRRFSDRLHDVPVSKIDA